jgi:hypothetical protein
MERPSRVNTRQSAAERISQQNEDDTTSVTVRQAEDDQMRLYLKEIALLEKEVPQSKNESLALEKRNVTARHHRKALTIVQSFLDCLKKKHVSFGSVFCFVAFKTVLLTLVFSIYY